MKTATYRATVAIGTGEEGERFVRLCNELAVKLNLLNVKGEPNYSALFKRAIESLAKDPELKRDTQ